MMPESALSAAEALQKELATPEPLPPLSLHRIETGLMELMEAREEAEADGLPPEALQPFDSEIRKYIAAHVAEVDSTHASILACRAFAAENRQRKEHAAICEKRWAAREERIMADTIWAMQNARQKCRECKGVGEIPTGPEGAARDICIVCHGEGTILSKIRVLETATNRLRIQKNGGLAPLDANIELLDDEYVDVTVTMTAAVWHEALRIVGETKAGIPTLRVAFEPDNARIRAALAQRVPCPECKGAGNRESTAMDEGGHITQEWTTCQHCEGNGNIQATVAGARLGDRGVNLRIE